MRTKGRRFGSTTEIQIFFAANSATMVKATKKDIQQIHRDFAMVVTKTDHFVQHPNEVLEKRGYDVLIESSFPAKRFKKEK